eukprot:TRINITY_DN7470_c0_g1_i2.p1 TRINITY_DN7470_c0_g1~~TRINITY_DN7470_c0_g1_i2.p1  ORF type:complete len:133 (-),score=27.25 TRINITY_DN7470_c0_g1_i2:33-431(-)
MMPPHMLPMPPYGGPGGDMGYPGADAPPRCYECGRSGHFARQCPARSRRLKAQGNSKSTGEESTRKQSSSAKVKDRDGGRGEEAKLNNDLEKYMKRKQAREEKEARRAKENAGLDQEDDHGSGNVENGGGNS